MKRLSVAMLVLALSAGSALAVDLVNKDSKKFDIKIHSGASTTSTSIESNTTKVSACDKCTIEVEGVGKIDAEGSEKVLIKDGKLSKE